MHSVSLPGLITASESDVGRVRTRNEDSFGEFSHPDGARLLIVADGMGGHRAGATASRVTVETVGEVFAASSEPTMETLRGALESANRRVHEMANADPELRGMGTTAVALLFYTAEEGFVAHVGDSRLYRYRDDVLRPLTRDHSVVAELERRGLITAEEATVHPRRNEIMRSIGIEADVEVEVQAIDVLEGDRYLLCSDGLSGMVDDTEIAVILEHFEPAEAARKLVERANEHGGTDNITVQIATISSEPVSPDSAPVPPPTTGVRPRLKQRRRIMMAVALVAAAAATALLVWRVYLIAGDHQSEAEVPKIMTE